MTASKLIAMVALASASASTSAAVVVFQDGSFDLSTYSVAIFQTGGAAIAVTHLPAGGNPGAALQADLQSTDFNLITELTSLTVDSTSHPDFSEGMLFGTVVGFAPSVRNLEIIT
jgi:hypothetical protein